MITRISGGKPELFRCTRSVRVLFSSNRIRDAIGGLQPQQAKDGLPQEKHLCKIPVNHLRYAPARTRGTPSRVCDNAKLSRKVGFSSHILRGNTIEHTIPGTNPCTTWCLAIWSAKKAG